MHVRPLNRHERQTRALALSLPPIWRVLAILCAVAIAADDWLNHFIAAGTRLLTSDGKRKLNGGKRRIADGTNNSCCCFVCNRCTVIPDSITVTISVWTPVACPGAAGAAVWQEGDLDGTHDLQPVNISGHVCVYIDQLPDGQLTMKKRLAGTSCVAPDFTEDKHFVYMERSSPSRWLIGAHDGTGADNLGADCQVCQDTFGAPTRLDPVVGDCCDTFSFTNSGVPGGLHGGTADVTVNCS